MSNLVLNCSLYNVFVLILKYYNRFLSVKVGQKHNKAVIIVCSNAVLNRPGFLDNITVSKYLLTRNLRNRCRVFCKAFELQTLRSPPF